MRIRSPIALVRLAERYAIHLGGLRPDPYLAWDRLGQILRALDPTQAFDLVCHLARTLPLPYLSTFGGGAVAHLLDHHGAMLIDWIEREALRNADFRTALSGAWVAGEAIHPTILIRLRTATAARIHIVRRAKRDAAYQAMFEQWVTGHPPRGVRHPRRTDVPEQLLHGRRVPSSVPPPVPASVVWGARFSTRLMLLQLGMSTKPRYLQDMLRGATAVWLPWFLLTTMVARFLLPVLVVVLCIVSGSLVTDLMLVALAFVLATAAAAVAGVSTGFGSERYYQFPRWLYVGLLTVIPYATLIVLIARARHGVFVAPAVIAVLLARQYAWRFVRRAWVAGRPRLARLGMKLAFRATNEPSSRSARRVHR